MNKFMACIAIFAIAILLIGSCNNKNTNSVYGKVTGIVFDQKTNLPVSGVEITTLPPTSSIITDDNGKFTISNINPGDFTIKAVKVGYQTKSININVTENNTNNIEFYLSEVNISGDSALIPEDLQPFTLIYLPLNNSIANLGNSSLITLNHNTNFVTDRLGNERSCIEFSGTGDSYLSFDYNKLLNQQDFSFCYWINANSYQITSEDNKVDIVSRWGNYNKGFETYAFGITTSFKPNYLLFSSDAKYSIGNIPQPISPNQWVHLCVTYSQGNLKYYFNGVKVFMTETVVPAQSNYYGMNIGSRYDVSKTQFSGKIDDFWMFSKALTDDEVDEIYHLK